MAKSHYQARQLRIVFPTTTNAAWCCSAGGHSPFTVAIHHADLCDIHWQPLRLPPQPGKGHELPVLLRLTLTKQNDVPPVLETRMSTT